MCLIWLFCPISSLKCISGKLVDNTVVLLERSKVPQHLYFPFYGVVGSLDHFCVQGTRASVQFLFCFISTDPLSPQHIPGFRCNSADYSQRHSDNFGNFLRRLAVAMDCHFLFEFFSPDNFTSVFVYLLNTE
jgi:hypothetical protein